MEQKINLIHVGKLLKSIEERGNVRANVLKFLSKTHRNERKEPKKEKHLFVQKTNKSPSIIL